MDILRVFFWFCKEQKIMDIIIALYNEEKLGKWEYKGNSLQFKPLSMKEFLMEKILVFGFHDIFWNFNPKDKSIIENPRFKKARSKWNAFSKNNIMFSDDFIKVGDTIEGRSIWGILYKGTVISFPKDFSGAFKIKTNQGKEEVATLIGCQTFKVNDIEKEPKFYIKRRKKIYGINKG